MNMPSEYNRQLIDDNCNTAYLYNSFLFIHKLMYIYCITYKHVMHVSLKVNYQAER